MEVSHQHGFADRKVGDVVAEDYRRAAVFKRFGIDFCCGGGRTVATACEKKGISYEALEQALNEADQANSTQVMPDTSRWDLGFLADYIVNVHHRYVRENIPAIRAFTSKVAKVHGHAGPELIEIAGLFEEVATELEEHLAKEEQILFPYVKELERAGSGETEAARPGFGSIQYPIKAMEHEHDRAGDLMRQIRELSSDFTPPDWACNTYRAAFVHLAAFEEDLHRHVHLENNVLFPRAIEMERALGRN